ncbi:AAA family ATPase [Sphingomonadaceae bacterium OTU29MARTA1]|nr:AAA family ATPase [Sphingomonadaceae bacterium OTU29MARTA1]
MKTLAFFNNKGGVGKTTLIYHLAYMFADLGIRVVVADLDPQANLTAMSLSLDDLDLIEDDELQSVYDYIAPFISGEELIEPPLVEVTDNFALLPGDLELSFVEDALSTAWSETRNDSELVRSRGIRISSALARAVREAGAAYDADVALIDVGPNLGALNRAALLGADYVIVPVAPDIFSLKGLKNVGSVLRTWRKGWASRAEEAKQPKGGWPTGDMEPIGYVVSRFSIYAGDKAKHFRKWINRVPAIFHRDVLRDKLVPPKTVEEDVASLAWLKDYHSLIAMAHEARKPIFKLRTADGAIGGHQGAVARAYEDFEILAYIVGSKIGLDMPEPTFRE